MPIPPLNRIGFITWRNMPVGPPLDKLRGMAIPYEANGHVGWRVADALELAAFREGRDTWLAGHEEPCPDAYMRLPLQNLYEEGYYAEVHDCAAAVRAYSLEDKRRHVPR